MISSGAPFSSTFDILSYQFLRDTIKIGFCAQKVDADLHSSFIAIDRRLKSRDELFFSSPKDYFLVNVIFNKLEQIQKSHLNLIWFLSKSTIMCVKPIFAANDADLHNLEIYQTQKLQISKDQEFHLGSGCRHYLNPKTPSKRTSYQLQQAARSSRGLVTSISLVLYRNSGLSFSKVAAPVPARKPKVRSVSGEGWSVSGYADQRQPQAQELVRHKARRLDSKAHRAAKGIHPGPSAKETKAVSPMCLVRRMRQ